MLQPLDVIKIFDRAIEPPNWKMVVCICPREGLFYRINSYDDFPIGVPILKDPDHRFLKWDSFIECGRYAIELDDHQIGEALKQSGGKPVGRIARSYAQEIVGAVQLQPTISREVKRLIAAALGGV